MTELGIAHLSLLQLDSAELVQVAAEAGYQFVGLRVRGATPSESWPDQRPGSNASRATAAALGETGLRVRDIEFLSLDGHTGREAWMPMLEIGAALGADTLNLAGQDPDASRLTDTLAQLVSDAADYGIVPALEAISYNEVSTVPQAAAIARAAGARVMLDPLHLQRGGSAFADVAALEPALIPVLQLCDGPAATPKEVVVHAPLPRGMSADGEPRKVESRALRLAPGEGEFDLTGLLRAVPAGTPISLEVPHAGLASKLGPLGYARYLREATLRLLEGIHAVDPTPSGRSK
jgi:sugar phosphate isomerase/epimerase